MLFRSRLFHGNVPERNRKCKGSQTSSYSSVIASSPSCGSDSDLGRSDSSKSSNFGHEEEDEEEEKDLALDYTQVLGK